MARPRKVQIPGESPAPEDIGTQTATLDDAPDAVESPEHELVRLRSQSAGFHAKPEPEPAKPAGLRAVDVDPTKIRRAVLTLDGWVCPDIPKD